MTAARAFDEIGRAIELDAPDTGLCASAARFDEAGVLIGSRSRFPATLPASASWLACGSVAGRVMLGLGPRAR